MTKAICVFCGAVKFGCLLACKSCGGRPARKSDVAYSYALSDHYFDLDQLEEISREAIANRCLPQLPPETEARFIKEFAAGFPD